MTYLLNDLLNKVKYNLPRLYDDLWHKNIKNLRPNRKTKEMVNWLVKRTLSSDLVCAHKTLMFI